jgi:hypothetical protein
MSMSWPAQMRWPAQRCRQCRCRVLPPEVVTAAGAAMLEQGQSSAAATAAVAAAAMQHQSFEPRIDGGVLTAQLLVLGATVGAAAYWWLALVPSARRTLAREKRTGALGSYLNELQSNPDRRLERWFYTDWLLQLERRQQLAASAAAKRAGRASGATSLPADAVPAASEAPMDGGMEDGDAEPAFLSLDNPIIATAALLTAVAGSSVLLRMLH